jgi:alpha-tubulin suppressor-like RCC1 family protein
MGLIIHHLLLVMCHQGQLASWGASEFGQLGQGGEGLSHHHPRILKAGHPHASKGSAGDHVRYIRQDDKCG